MFWVASECVVYVPLRVMLAFVSIVIMNGSLKTTSILHADGQSMHEIESMYGGVMRASCGGQKSLEAFDSIS